MKKNKSALFIGAVLIISVMLFVVYFSIQEKGEQVVITVGGEVFKTVPLNTNQTIELEFDTGEYNIIEIKDGEVDVTESSCENQICVNDYPISKDYPGVIVCLPHGLVIEIKE